MTLLSIVPLLLALGLGPHTAAASNVAATEENQDELVKFGQSEEVTNFIDQMVEKHHFEKAKLQAILAQVEYSGTAIRLMKPGPPGQPKNWQTYRARFVEPIRVNAGVQFWNDNAGDLERAEIQYGVPAEIIVGIIGIETIYG
ncbi:MAG: lytic murein transglycosylase, partial [bacterium]